MRYLAALCLLAACTDDKPAPSDLAVSDLASADHGAGSAIGGTCATDSDCVQGKTPVCWVKNYLNLGTKVLTPGGFCTSSCVNDTDCGPTGLCVLQVPSDGSFCMPSCSGAADCRTGYACFTRSPAHCFSNGALSCDPTAGDGTCKGTGTQPGGCFRFADGPGKTGICYDGCKVGPGTCPSSGGTKRSCRVYDTTGTRDLQNNLTGDKFKGPICDSSDKANADGTECVFMNQDHLYECVDGDECYLARQFSGGDNRNRIGRECRLRLFFRSSYPRLISKSLL